MRRALLRNQPQRVGLKAVHCNVQGQASPKEALIKEPDSALNESVAAILLHRLNQPLKGREKAPGALYVQPQ